jgi:hypothetical protein
VASEQQFGLFQDDDDGPLWRASFDDLDEAMHNGQKLADDERHGFFVYSFKDYREVARFFPSRHKT